MAYVDYEYYTETYKAGLDPAFDSASFNFLEKKAENYLNLKTLGAYKEVTDEDSIAQIKECLCALVDAYYDEESSKEQGMVKQSESVGGHSVSYAVSLSSFTSNSKDEIIRSYLWNLGLIRTRKVYGINEG